MRTVWDEQNSICLAYVFSTQKNSVFWSIFDLAVSKRCLEQDPL